MKITVTEDDILQGIKHDCFDCPIALAIKRTKKCNVQVNTTYWRILESDKYGSLPYKAIVFIAAFDNDLEVKPFEFEI